MNGKKEKEKFFDSQTLINMFRNKPTNPARSPPKENPMPVKPQNPALKDVLEYKQLLAYKMNEADLIEKEEHSLLETRIREIQKVALLYT